MNTQQNTRFVLMSIIQETTVDIRQILDTLGPDWIKSYGPLDHVRQSAQNILDNIENFRNISLYDATSYLKTDVATWRTYVEKYDGKSKSH